MIGKLLMGTGVAGGTAVAANERAKSKVLSAVDVPAPYQVEGPVVSIIIPAYNEEDYLPVLLSTIRHQTYYNVEIIVVDDASEDRTKEVAESYGALVVEKIDGVQNVAKSRNMGAKYATGHYLVFADADGAFEHSLVEKTVKELDKGKVLVYSNHCSTDDVIQGTIRVIIGYLDPVSNETLSYLTNLVSINGQYIAVTKEAFEAVGGYNEALTPEGAYGEDRRFAMDVMERYGIDKVGFLRWTFSGTSSRRAKKMGYLGDITNRFKRYFQVGTHEPMDRQKAIR